MKNDQFLHEDAFMVTTHHDSITLRNLTFTFIPNQMVTADTEDVIII